MGNEKKGIIGNVYTTAATVVTILSVITLLHDWRNVQQWYSLETRISLPQEILPILWGNESMNYDHDKRAAVMVDPPRTKCVPWNAETAFNRTVQPIDEWWVHNVAWFSHTTNETHACWIEETRPSKRRNFAHQMYAHQHLGDCSRLHYRIMWSSGWGADITNVLGALRRGQTEHHAPAVMGWDKQKNLPKAWHYSANKERDITFPNGTVDYSRLNPTCPEKDLSCYFLPYHNCGPVDDIVNDTKKHFFVGEMRLGSGGPFEEESYRYYLYYEWLSRPLIWFRRAVFDYQKEQGLVDRLVANLEKEYGNNDKNDNNNNDDDNSDDDDNIDAIKGKKDLKAKDDKKDVMGQCSVLHVRRADVVLHGTSSRKYHSISEYVDSLPESANKQHLVLLTDDANAIDEALEFYPNKTWYFYNRTRHRGSSGGWEHQVPSLNPAQEVIAMFAIFDLVEHYCSHFVYGESSFGLYVWYYMQRKDTPVFRHRVEKDMLTVYRPSNKDSEAQLAQQLRRVRQGEVGKDKKEDESKEGAVTPNKRKPALSSSLPLPRTNSEKGSARRLRRRGENKQNRKNK